MSRRPAIALLIILSGAVAVGIAGLLLAPGAMNPRDTAGPSPGADAATAYVFASNAPLSYFAKRLGGRPERVRGMSGGAGVDGPLLPNDADLAAMQGAARILFNGAGYEAWAGHVSLPARRIVDTSAGFADRLIARPTVSHRHGPEGEHSHTQTVSTTWLDPALARLQADAVADALVAAGLVEPADIARRLALLHDDLARLDDRLQAAARRLAGRQLFATSHGYAYLVRHYGLTLQGVVSNHGSDDAQLTTTLRGIAAIDGSIVLWPTPPPAALYQGADTPPDHIVIFRFCDPPLQGDFLTCMTENAEALERAAQE